MGGFFGAASTQDCVFDLFFGIDYHSHLGTKRGGMVVYGENGFDRAIHNIENAPFRISLIKTFRKCQAEWELAVFRIMSHSRYWSAPTMAHMRLPR